MADLLSKKATVKNICGTNPVMIHPVGATRIINPGQEFTGIFPIGEIQAMEASEQYSVTSAAEHKSAEPDNAENSGEPVKKLTKAEKEAAKAAQAQTPAVPVVPPAAPALPGASGLPSALQLPGSGN